MTSASVDWYITGLLLAITGTGRPNKCAMAPRWTPAHKQLNLTAAKDRYSGLLSLVRIVRAIIPATKSQLIRLLALYPVTLCVNLEQLLSCF